MKTLGHTKSTKATTKIRAKRSKSRVKAQQEKILAGLKTAGADGVQVDDLAAILHLGPCYLGTWLARASRRIPGLQRLGLRLYRFVEVPKPAKTTTKGMAKPVRRKKVVLRTAILEALKAAGEGGLRCKDVASETGLPLEAVADWLARARYGAWPDVERLSWGRYKFLESPKLPAAQLRQEKRAMLTPRIVEALKAAGQRGLQFKELRAKFGLSAWLLKAYLTYHRNHSRTDRLEDLVSTCKSSRHK